MLTTKYKDWINDFKQLILYPLFWIAKNLWISLFSVAQAFTIWIPVKIQFMRDVDSACTDWYCLERVLILLLWITVVRTQKGTRKRMIMLSCRDMQRRMQMLVRTEMMHRRKKVRWLLAAHLACSTSFPTRLLSSPLVYCSKKFTSLWIKLENMSDLKLMAIRSWITIITSVLNITEIASINMVDRKYQCTEFKDCYDTLSQQDILVMA